MKTTNEKLNEIKQMTVEEEIAEFRMRLRNLKQRVERLENHVHAATAASSSHSSTQLPMALAAQKMPMGFQNRKRQQQ